MVDSVTPEIDGIVRVGPNDAATGELTNADTVHFRVNFSEPVDLSTVTPSDFVVSAANPDGSDATDLALTIDSGFLADDGQIETGSLEPGTTMDHTYVVVSGTGLVSFDGTIELAPSAGGAFADPVGNIADGSFLADQSIAGGVAAEPADTNGSAGGGQHYNINPGEYQAQVAALAAVADPRGEPAHAGKVDLFDLPVVDAGLGFGDVAYQLSADRIWNNASGEFSFGVAAKDADGNILDPTLALDGTDTGASGVWTREFHYNNPTVSFTPEPGVSYVAFFAAHGNWTNYNMMFEYVADAGTVYGPDDVPAAVNIAASQPIPAFTAQVEGFDGAAMPRRVLQRRIRLTTDRPHRGHRRGCHEGQDTAA